MMRPSPLKFGLSLKLLLIGELVLLVAVLTLLIPLRRVMREQVIRDLQDELRSIAVTAALQFDGDDLKTIRTGNDVGTPQFAKLRKMLNRARVANRVDIERIHTFYRDADNTVRFGVMTHPRPFVGDRHEPRPEMRTAFDHARSNVTGLYTDGKEEFVSAYAPIFDSQLQLAGMLGVEKSATDYFRVYREVQRTTLITAGSVFVMSSMLGWLVLNRVVIRPMRAVRQGMLALGRQDFSHRVEVRTRDEFEELGETLNNISGQLNVARSVQMSFMPKTLPTQTGYRIAAATEPCEATAGDYVDAFALDDERVAVLVADVTGHGLGPSLLMSACRSALHALVMADLSPAQVIARLDALLAKDLTEGRFITMIFGILDAGGTFTFTNAGHGPAMVVINGKCSVLEAHRPPLGVGLDEPEDLAEQSTVRLGPGDRVFLCSDGVSEAMDDDGEQFGNERIARIVSEASLDAQLAVEKIRDAIRVHSGRSVMKDDVTILCVDRVGNATPASAELLPKSADAERENHKTTGA